MSDAQAPAAEPDPFPDEVLRWKGIPLDNGAPRWCVLSGDGALNWLWRNPNGSWSHAVYSTDESRKRLIERLRAAEQRAAQLQQQNDEDLAQAEEAIRQRDAAEERAREAEARAARLEAQRLKGRKLLYEASCHLDANDSRLLLGAISKHLSDDALPAAGAGDK